MFLRKCFLVVFALLLISPAVWAQNLVHIWSQSFGDESDYQYSEGVAIDGSGNVVITGWFKGTMDFGGGVLTNAGCWDIYLAKFDASGNHIWSKRFGDSECQSSSGVAVDGSGNIIIAGRFSGTVDFGGGPLTSVGNANAYLAKFDPNGNHIWSQSFLLELSPFLAVDGSGNVIITGVFEGTVDFGGGVLTSAGYDIYVAKFDAGCNHIWSQHFGDSETQAGEGVAADGSGNIFVLGTFEGTVDFGGGVLTSAGMKDVFLVKFDAGGSHIWSQHFGDSDYPCCISVAADGLGNAVITGTLADTGAMDFGGGVLTSAGGGDIYVAAFDAGGNHIWSSLFGDSENQGSKCVAADGSGNVVITGNFNGTVDFGGGALTDVGGGDIFIAKFDASGNHIWSQHFGDSDLQRGKRVAIDDSGNVVATGEFWGTVDFGGGPLTSAGNEDVFVAKFGPPPSPVCKLDIKPRSCPNPFNIKWLENIDKGKGKKHEKPKRGGVLPVAIVGSADFDVTEIDVSTLLLNGVEPLRSSLEDVTMPVSDGDECACTTGGPDGIMDLTLKFLRQEIAATFMPAEDGDIVVLTITGELYDGTKIEASDCITILSKHPKTPMLTGGEEVELGPPTPNPFNPTVRIAYWLPRSEGVKVSIYDVSGRLVERLVDVVQPHGEHVIEWDARGLSSGTYFCRLEAGDEVRVKRMTLLK